MPSVRLFQPARRTDVRGLPRRGSAKNRTRAGRSHSTSCIRHGRGTEPCRRISASRFPATRAVCAPALGAGNRLVSTGDAVLWLIASVAVVPGMGHLLQRQWLRAGLLLAATVILFGLIVLLIRNQTSDVLISALLALSLYSVWDVANTVFPRSSADEGALTLRALRLVFVSVGIVAGTVFGVSLFLGRWYALWVFATDQAAPAFLRGDGLMVRRLPHPEQQLHRGDVAVYFEDRTLLPIPQTERVVGLPGDHIAGSGNTLRVNGVSVPLAILPMTFHTLAAPVDIVVGDGQVCLWRGLSGNTAEASDAAPYLLVGADQIQGQAIAIYQPPQRRRWFR